MREYFVLRLGCKFRLFIEHVGKLRFYKSIFAASCQHLSAFIGNFITKIFAAFVQTQESAEFCCLYTNLYAYTQLKLFVNMDNSAEAPTWFVKFAEDTRNFYATHLRTIENLPQRIAALETGLRAEMKNEIDNIRNELETLKLQPPATNLLTIFQPQPDDACEIKVSGIPEELCIPESTAVEKIVSAIGLSSVKHHVLKIRK